MKRSLLKVLMVLALGAVICLPGVAAADIYLTFDSSDGFTSLTSGDYGLFTWDGWTVTSGAAIADNGATISLASDGAFNFDGAAFMTAGATSLTIIGTKAVGGTVEFGPEALGTSLQTYSFDNFKGITLLTFNTKTNEVTGGNFVMDNFADVVVPLPPTALLLGSGLVGLGLLGWRRRKAS